MSFRSSAAKKAVLRIVGAITVARAAVVMVGLTNESLIHAQLPKTAARPSFRLPDEAAGIDGIVQTLISVYDQADIVALGEAHGRRADSDLRIALVRHPDFAKKVRSIVVEFGSTTEQSTLDRYIRGENVSRAQLERVWKTTSNGVWDSPIYADFFTAVRDVNSKLPADGRIRVFGGDPGPTDQRDRETAAVAVLEDQVLSKHGKALVIYGAAHFYRTAPASFGISAELARTLEKAHPGRIYTVIPIGGDLDPPPPSVSLRNPDYRKFESALKTQIRPVLIPLQRPPFRDFTAEEFLGGGIFSCVGLAVVEAHSRAASLLSDRWRMRAFTLVLPRPGGILNGGEVSNCCTAGNGCGISSREVVQHPATALDCHLAVSRL